METICEIKRKTLRNFFISPQDEYCYDNKTTSLARLLGNELHTLTHSICMKPYTEIFDGLDFGEEMISLKKTITQTIKNELIGDKQ